MNLEREISIQIIRIALINVFSLEEDNIYCFSELGAIFR